MLLNSRVDKSIKVLIDFFNTTFLKHLIQYLYMTVLKVLHLLKKQNSGWVFLNTWIEVPISGIETNLGHNVM